MKNVKTYLNQLMVSLSLVASVTITNAQVKENSSPQQKEIYMLNKKEKTVRDIRLSYSIQGTGSPVLLIHGWPQTQDEWRHVVPLLTDNHTVITVDLPGIAGSEPSKEGYSKKELARYINDLVLELGYKKIAVIGHDIGGQVAYSYARYFPDVVEKVAIIDVPIPGMPGWEQERGKWPRWHFAFHQQKELPEILVRDNVAGYLNYFFKELTYNKAALNDQEAKPFIEAYSNETTLHAGFELYRAFEKDAKDNAGSETDKLKIPVLAIGGEYSRIKDYVPQQLKEAAENLTAAVAPGCGHFIPEENPEWLADRILQFVSVN